MVILCAKYESYRAYNIVYYYVEWARSQTFEFANILIFGSICYSYDSYGTFIVGAFSRFRYDMFPIISL